MAREFTKVGVVGLGTMGTGIAQVLARHGIAVVGVEVDDEAAQRGVAAIEASTQRAVAGEKMTAAERDELLARVAVFTDLGTLADCELVVEALPEDLDLKVGVLARLNEILPHDAILGTQASALSVTEISVGTGRPQQVIGMQFFNPAPVQPFMEIVRTVVTEQDVVDDVVALAERLGKTPVVCGDSPGFIANALLFGYLNHAVTMLESKYATREDIDAAMVYGCGYPMGPLALLDLIGLDTAYAGLETMYQRSGDRLHSPAPLLKHMVAAGLTGRKVGAGFYTYEGPGSGAVVADALTPAASAESGSVREVRRVGVVGSGTMATGIVEVFAKSGYDTVVVARSDEKASAAKAAVEKSLNRAVSKGRLGEAQRDEILGRVTPAGTREALADVDLVVEAVAEDIAIKRELFADLDRICKPGAILATTTSSLPVIECAVATSRPGDVIGMHFFNPAPLMKLVEVVTTVSTDAEVARTVHEVCRRTKKVAVACGDRAGFIVNALLFPYLNDAVSMLEAHYATIDEIDTAMKVGCSLPMGPFTLLDVVGLDVSLAIQRTLYAEFRASGWKPAPLLEHLVTAGYLGRKTRRGFRDYSAS
jgi:3-hydroxybutyryl-CoA dehydrogenase